MPSDPRLIARIAIQYELVSHEQLADCMTDPEADTGLAEVMADPSLNPEVRARQTFPS